jgi:hypothetical protein
MGRLLKILNKFEPLSKLEDDNLAGFNKRDSKGRSGGRRRLHERIVANVRQKQVGHVHVKYPGSPNLRPRNLIAGSNAYSKTQTNPKLSEKYFTKYNNVVDFL